MNGIRIAGAFAAFIAAPGLHAGDGTIASLVDISGNVLLSRDFNIVSVAEPVRLAPGTRVLATLNASAIVAYDNGHQVRLSGGERIEVVEEPVCRDAPVDRFDGVADIAEATRR
jgi:hypothetical protein